MGKLAGFSSKHAKLRGVDGLFFGTLALGYKARIPLILGAVAATLFATGDPLQKIAALRPGGGGTSRSGRMRAMMTLMTLMRTEPRDQMRDREVCTRRESIKVYTSSNDS